MRKYLINDEFLTAQEAAIKYDVRIGTIYTASNRNTLNSLGKKRGPKPLPVRIRGIGFDSAEEAGKHNNVKTTTVWSALAQCKENNVGKVNNPHFKDELKAMSKS